MKVVRIQSRLERIGWEIVDDVAYSSDENSKDDKNDVSIISEAAFTEGEKSLEKGFCHDRFQPNLVISMNKKEEEQIKVNAELDIENVRLFVLHKNHHCHENCPLFRMNRRRCQWTGHIYYAWIKRGGRVKKGSTVSIKNP